MITADNSPAISVMSIRRTASNDTPESAPQLFSFSSFSIFNGTSGRDRPAQATPVQILLLGETLLRIILTLLAQSELIRDPPLVLSRQRQN